MSSKRILSACLSVCMAMTSISAFSSAALMAAAQEDAGVLSGRCGENVTWTLEDGTLTISGSGRMWDLDWGFGSGPAEWYDYADQIETVVINEGVTSIGRLAFLECVNVTDIRIPDSLEILNADALTDTEFYRSQTTDIKYLEDWCVGCEDDVTEAVIKEGTRHIANDAFFGNENLISVTIPEGVTTMGWEVFYACTNLSSISIPDSMEFIEEECFEGTALLSQAEGIVYSNHWILGCSKDVELVEIAEDTKGIAGNAFAGCDKLLSLTIPDGVETIGPCAFIACRSLTYVIMPDSVKRVGAGLFYFDPVLSTVRLSNHITSFETAGHYSEGFGFFEACSSLKRLNIPAMLDSNELWKLRGMVSEFTVPEDCLNYSILDGVIYNKDQTELVLCPKNYTPLYIGEFEIPDTVKRIGEYAFAEQNDAKFQLVLPESVEYISDCAFSESYLDQIHLSSGLKAIGEAAFFSCRFLEKITFPDEVGEISSSAFYGTPWSEQTDEQGLIFAGKVLYSADAEGDLVIPDGTVRINEGAFSNSHVLSVVIPESVTRIDESAFTYCPMLSSVTILNPYCRIYDRSDTICNRSDWDYNSSFSGTIYGYDHSTAQAYAEAYGYAFESLGEAPEAVYGDVDGDSKLTVADVILLQKWLLAAPGAQLLNWKAADLNADDQIDVFDLCLMKRQLLNQ